MKRVEDVTKRIMSGEKVMRREIEELDRERIEIVKKAENKAEG